MRQVISLRNMSANQSLVLLVVLLGWSVAHAEAPNTAPTAPVSPTAPSPANNNIKIFDDRVFDLGGGTYTPETRTSPGGNTRYLDKDKELNYNTEQRGRWMAACESLKETDFKAYSQCVESQKKKELGSRTNFGAREPRSGDEKTPPISPRGMEDVKPSMPEETSAEDFEQSNESESE